MILSEALKKFLEYQNVCGNSLKTIAYYKRTISYFIDFAGNRNVNTYTSSDYNDYVIYLRNKNVVNNNIEKNKKRCHILWLKRN